MSRRSITRRFAGLVGNCHKARARVASLVAAAAIACGALAQGAAPGQGGLLLVRAASPLHAPAAATPAAVLEVTGYGFGHGRGMGQWGAFGYASELGWDYRQILAHYYGGTVLGTVSAPEPDVTVRLTEMYGHDTVAAALAGQEVVATWAGGGVAEGQAVEVTGTKGLRDVLVGPSCAGPWKDAGSAEGAVTLASSQPGAATPLAASIGSSEIQACAPAFGERTYQGQLVSLPTGQTDNVVGLEDYVDGVVPAESPASWASEGGEAELEAQAVAARSYALATIAASGSICDDTACQMYVGLPSQYGLTADAAVAATAGQVLYCRAGSACGPAGAVALTEYSASTGGYTAGGAFPAVPDLGDAVPANPVHEWRVAVPVSQVEAAFPSVGDLTSVEVTTRNGLGEAGGRAETVVVSGSLGSVTLTGDELAADLSLRSNWFVVAPLAGAGRTAPPTSSSSTTVPRATTLPATTVPATTVPATTVPATTVPATTVPATTTVTGATVPGATVPGATSAPRTTFPVPDGPPGPSASGAPSGAPGGTGGYWVADAQGQVAAFGGAPFYGDATGTAIQGEVAAMAVPPGPAGYWLAGSNGQVLAFGAAKWYGPSRSLHLEQPIVAMASTPEGGGYWLVSADGGVFAFGDARYYGSAAARSSWAQEGPVVGFAPTPDGAGYWLVTQGGTVLAFGDAMSYGPSPGSDVGPVAGIVPSGSGSGYLLVERNGGAFAFGDAAYLGSLAGPGARATVLALAPAASGYYVAAAGGRVYGFGDVVPPGSAGRAGALGGPAVAIACERPTS